MGSTALALVTHIVKRLYRRNIATGLRVPDPGEQTAQVYDYVLPRRAP